MPVQVVALDAMHVAACQDHCAVAGGREATDI